MPRSFPRSLWALTLLLVPALPLAAQPPTPPGPEPEHALLKKFVGEWVTESECTPGPDLPKTKSHGTIKARMLGDLWMVAEHDMTSMDMKINAIVTLGYDPQKKAYVGTWVDSMFNHLWHYRGTAEGNTLSLDAEGPSMAEPGKTAMYRDSYEFISDNEIRVTSQIEMEKDKWITFMTGVARRKKS